MNKYFSIKTKVCEKDHQEKGYNRIKDAHFNLMREKFYIFIFYDPIKKGENQ